MASPAWTGRSALLGLAALVLAVLGGAAVIRGVADQEASPPGPPTTPGPAGRDITDSPSDRSPSSASASGRPERPPLELGYSRPVRIRIDAIDVDSPLVELGLDASGVMETPVEVQKAGWFRPSPPPGVPGAAVIAGHVTWNQVPAVFFALGDLRRGDPIDVERADGRVARFEVTRLGSFAKDRFPTEQVYDQPSRPELRLITCGGEYDAASHRYLDNVIVWARLVDVRR